MSIVAISRWFYKSRPNRVIVPVSGPSDVTGTEAETKSTAKALYTKRRLFYLVDWLPPDFGAVGQYGLFFAREYAEGGREVRLIGLSSSVSSIVTENFARGLLRVTRLRATPFRKTSSIQRLLWALRANSRLVWAVINDPESRNAELIFTGSPPFMLYFSFLAKALKGCRLIYRITDFYPEVLLAAWGRKPLPFALIERITWILRRHVDEFQVLGEDQRRLLLAGGIDPRRISLKRDVAPVAISTNEAPARHPAELRGFRVILYSGNFGVAHDVATIRDGLIRHHHEGSRRFGLWLNASGSAVVDLVASLRAEGVPVAVTPPCSLEMLPGVLAAADVHLISLKANFAGYVLPSKLYGCLSSKRPILFVGPKCSDIHLLCDEDKTLLYRQVENDDAEAFALALEDLADRRGAPMTAREA
jgi:hypothetical protein